MNLTQLQCKRTILTRHARAVTGVLLLAWLLGHSANAAAVAPSLDEQVASVLPNPDEERFLSVGWRTNLMRARLEAQAAGKPLFLWIMVGNPQGCT